MLVRYLQHYFSSTTVVVVKGTETTEGIRPHSGSPNRERRQEGGSDVRPEEGALLKPGLLEDDEDG
jgi:hypothetical protein